MDRLGTTLKISSHTLCEEVEFRNGTVEIKSIPDFSSVSIATENERVSKRLNRWETASLECEGFGVFVRRAGLLMFRSRLSFHFREKGLEKRVDLISRQRFLLAMRIWLMVAGMVALTLAWSRVSSVAVNVFVTLTVGSIFLYLIVPNLVLRADFFAASIFSIAGTFLAWDLLVRPDWILTRFTVLAGIVVLCLLACLVVRFWRKAVTSAEDYFFVEGAAEDPYV